MEDTNKQYYRDLLRRYLKRYSKCKHKEKALKERASMILEYRTDPLKGIAFSDMPKASSGVSSGAAALTLEIEELHERIERQRNDSVLVLSSIMDILEFLPDDSIERFVLERRYIDLQPQVFVMSELELKSRTAVHEYTIKGLDMLLEYDKVIAIIMSYDQALRDGELSER